MGERTFSTSPLVNQQHLNSVVVAMVKRKEKLKTRKPQRLFWVASKSCRGLSFH
jgi:hypothetical protein